MMSNRLRRCPTTKISDNGIQCDTAFPDSDDTAFINSQWNFYRRLYVHSSIPHYPMRTPVLLSKNNKPSGFSLLYTVTPRSITGSSGATSDQLSPARCTVTN